MDKYPPEAWRRLGRALERRRGQLGYGFRQRGRFARDNGDKLSAKTLARLEHGERTGYPLATLALVDAMYGWVPGSVERVLKGGEPEPIPEAGPGQFPDIDPADYAGDALLYKIATDPDLSDSKKKEYIFLALRMRAQNYPGNGKQARQA